LATEGKGYGSELRQDVMVSAVNLQKKYRIRGGADDFVAVAGVDFTLRRGEFFGFLGPNGAGKTTTMKMISCVSPPSGGRLEVLGMDPVSAGQRIRARIGVVPQLDALDRELTVRENLMLYGRYFGIPKATIRERTARLLDFAQLTEKSDMRVDALSGGMCRRLTISRALINEPELILLDEPTTGLDPQARHVVWERLFRLKQEGVTQILTTHYMDEAEQLCDRLVVMDKGRIVAGGTPTELIERYCAREVVELRFAEKPWTDEVDGLGQRIEMLPDRMLVYTEDSDQTMHRVHQLSLHPVTALVRRSSLEDVFLALTGRSLIE
jgi:lipooligosaccharide transport system ATP-binding protein